jgi:hypothetical protein
MTKDSPAFYQKDDIRKLIIVIKVTNASFKQLKACWFRHNGDWRRIRVQNEKVILCFAQKKNEYEYHSNQTFNTLYNTLCTYQVIGTTRAAKDIKESSIHSRCRVSCSTTRTVTFHYNML